MDCDNFSDYWEAITVIEAQETLMSYSQADWPNTKKDERRERHRKLHSMAYPNAWKKSEKMSGEQMAELLKGFVSGRR